jgi:hypothetical protein
VRSDKEFNYITSFYFETGIVQLLKLQIAQKKADTKMTTGQKLEASAVSVVISAGHLIQIIFKQLHLLTKNE